jgi:hypothetical protein
MQKIVSKCDRSGMEVETGAERIEYFFPNTDDDKWLCVLVSGES